MNLIDELDNLNLETAAKTKVAAMIQALLDQSKKDAAELYTKDLKIQALILELAMLRRMRFGAKSESLSPLQKDLFDEACATDIAAIEAEIEQLNTTPRPPKPPRPRAGRKMLLHFLHSPHPCGLSPALTGASATH